ncbi:hypothetical protein K443DRAFT_182203 [Laccaria amethystina LaAM-08-1]|uniref:Hydrophobin n=1 Tax=Laccaria amethystina LaAM-08-1 TaxID=1095629 RepID=A0A0C9X5E4_9AGAR|nr:hypothetical protein K443DRAFT_182203 [Laccaria amethystina LaAM-08-1]
MNICRRWLQLAFWGLTSVSLVHSVTTPPLPQSFFFDWNAPGQPYPIPVTAQCESIHIVWQRSTATGFVPSLSSLPNECTISPQSEQCCSLLPSSLYIVSERPNTLPCHLYPHLQDLHRSDHHPRR